MARNESLFMFVGEGWGFSPITVKGL